VARSFGWSVGGQLAQRGAAWLSTILLVHLLEPDDYGTYSIAATVSMFLLAFNDLAVSYAVTRYEGDDLDELAGTAASVAMGLSASIYAIVFAAAPAIVSLFDPRDGSPAVGVVRLAALSIVIDGVIAAQGGLITRALREQIRVPCEVAGLVCSLSVNIALAFAGLGVWSLAAGQVAGSGVTASLLLLRTPFRVRPRWNTERARSLVRFGLPLVVAGTFNQLILNSDYLVVNRYLGQATAGAYFVAFNVSNWPVTLIHFAMRRSALGGFSRLQGDPVALRRAFAQATRLLVSATLPMAALVATLAPEIMAVLFPARYGAGATALRFLAGISVIRLVFALAIDLLTIKGRSAAILWVQAVWWIALVAGLWWGATRHGLVGVGVAQLAAALGIALPLLAWCLSREGVAPAAVVAGLGRPAAGGVALVAAALAARAPFDPALARLAAGSLAGLAAYAAVVLPGTPVASRIRRTLPIR
jgi:PST family polysaccharide transporter